MVAPIDYSLDVQAPFQSALQGFQGASAIRGTLLQQDAQAAQAAQQEAMRKDLASLSANPTPQAVAQMSLRYPQLSEQFKRSFDMLGEDQKRARLSSTIPVYAAIQSGRPDVAAGRLRETATAQENSGQKEEAARTRAMADLIEQHPEAGATTAGLLLSSVMGPDKFAETFGKLGAESRAVAEAPSDLAKKREEAKKAKSDAEIAAVKAQFAGSEAIADLEKKGWDIKKIAADIDVAKQNSRIAAMNAQTSRMNSDLQRQELALKIEEATAKRDSTIREKVATAEAGANSIDNMLNTIERVKKNPALNAVLGSIEGGRFYPQRLAGMLPGTASADDRADAVALIETLGSQAFVAQIPNIKGTGALSDAEGKKLQSALQNLSREQSEKQFRENLDEAARLLTKGREGLARATGVPLGKPDTPAAPGARPPLSAFNK